MIFELPKTKEGLRIKHLDLLADTDLGTQNMSIHLIVEVVSRFTGVSRPQVMRVDAYDLRKIFDHIVKVCNEINPRAEVLKEIEIDGRLYELVDPERVPAGWHIDVSNTLKLDKRKSEKARKPIANPLLKRNETKENDEIDPVKVACICYIPKGTKYGDIDDHDNLMYPISSRYKLFAEHFPLEAFIALSGFFLIKFNRSMSAFMARQKRELLRNLVNTIGRRSLIAFPRSRG